ncbi:MAG: extracellular solute-binding protein [Clostridiales bacterium]|nr:extracellular solute-binding protein [Clostridiales bacterium]
MKKILVLLICMMACIIISCKESEEVVAVKEKITFRITWKAYSGRGEAIQKIVETFNLSQKDYMIETISGDENLEEIKELMSTDRVDVFVLPYRYVQLLGDEGYLSSFSKEDISDAEMISDGLFDLSEVNEIYYGIPWVSHSMALIYNKDLLAEAGVDANSIVDRRSFESALQVIEEMTDANGIGLVGANHNDVSWMVNQFIYGNGGRLIENNQVAINTEQSRYALQYYRDTLSKYAQETWLEDTGAEVMAYFRNEDIAFEVQGLWGITDIWRNDNPFEVGVLSLDKIGANSEVGPMMLSYGKTISDEKREVINSFIEYMISEEAQVAIMKGEFSPERNEYYPFRLPVRQDILESEAFEPYQVFNVFITSYGITSIDVPTPKWMIIKETLYAPNLNRLMKREITIDEFFNIIKTEGDKILKGEE